MDNSSIVKMPKPLSEMKFSIDNSLNSFKERVGSNAGEVLGNLKTFTTTANSKIVDLFKNSNIIGLVISIMIAFYISDLIYYIVDTHIVKYLNKGLKHVYPAVIQIGGIKINSRKLIRKIVRFLILSLILVVIFLIGLNAGLIKH